MIIHGQFYDGIVGKPDLDDALEHYGVLGMKWGVRKDPERAYSKATKKSEKLSKKIAKANKKYLKKAKLGRLPITVVSKRSVQNARSKVDLLTDKKKKWDEAVEKAFEGTKYDKKKAEEKPISKDLQKKISDAVRDNQDMFNDLLYDADYGIDRDKADERARKILKDVAKEYGIKDVTSLGRQVMSNYQKREADIAARKKKMTKEDVMRSNLEEDIKNNHVNSKSAQDFKQQQVKTLRNMTNKQSSSDIENKVKYAKKTGMYDMEFLERNLDTDQKTGESLQGKALDDAYRKYLKNRK